MKPILAASIQDCHVIGVDSIVLKSTVPMVRVYLARENHVLWRNHPERGHMMSLGLHQHRQDITMIPLFGFIFNVLIDNRKTLSPRQFLHLYEYSSQIANGKGGFIKLKSNKWEILKVMPLSFPTFLPGTTAHSVYVPEGEVAAWMICEGKINKFYNSLLSSNDPNLENSDFSRLYQPMTQGRLDEDMEIIERNI